MLRISVKRMIWLVLGMSLQLLENHCFVVLDQSSPLKAYIERGGMVVRFAQGFTLR